MKGKFLSVMTAFAVMAGSMALAGQAHDEHNKDKDDAHRHHMSKHTDKDTTTTIHHRGGSQTVTYYHQAKHPGDPDYKRDEKYGKHTNHQAKHPGDPDYNRDEYYGQHSKHKTSWYQAVTRRHRTGSTYRASEYRARLARLQAERNRQRDLDRDRDWRAHHHVRHDNGKHKGWWKGKGNPHHG